MPDGVPSIHHTGGGTYGFQGPRSAGADTLRRGGTPHRRDLWPGHHCPRQYHERGLHGPNSNQQTSSIRRRTGPPQRQLPTNVPRNFPNSSEGSRRRNANASRGSPTAGPICRGRRIPPDTGPLGIAWPYPVWNLSCGESPWRSAYARRPCRILAGPLCPVLPGITPAACLVVVDHTYRLQEGIDDDRAHEVHPPAL